MTRLSPRSLPSRSRGTRAVHDEDERDEEGTGGPTGVVLPLNMVGAGMYEAVYTLAVQVGSNNQNFSLQVDTGSSDLWIASTSCSSSACSSSKGRQYDPSASGNATGSNFQIQYLSGKVSGPVYWDKVQIGAYTVNNQALAAATSVDFEPLEHEFNGILGLALPLNSVIAQQITPVTGNGRDGAPLVSNLFGISPASSAPSSRFLSLSLARPGSSAIPSFLGIGRHPSQLVHDPSKIKYSKVVQESQGSLFWQVEVRAITVYVNGSSFSVKLNNPRSGNVLPTAVLDSGVPYILAESNIADGIYGALGIGPASDGQYYVPCTTPINMTILIDGQAEIPLHPLDLSTQSSSDPSSSTCVGLIQTGGGALDTTPSVSDMILGAAFMRNVYTVMAYDAPDTHGTFPNGSASTAIQPHLGLLSLTNATRAMEEFHDVRVLNQPLSSDDPSSSTPQIGAPSSSGKLSVGIVVLCVLVGIIAACVILFGLWWVLVRRRLRRSPHLDTDIAEPKLGGASAMYSLAPQGSLSPARMSSAVSIAGNSARTVVGQDETAVGEFGLRDKDKAERQVSYLNLDPGDPSGWRDTLVETIDFPKLPDPASTLEAAMLASDEPISSTRDAALAATVAAGLPLHRHTASDIGGGPDRASAAEPLLAHQTHPSNDSTASLAAISERGHRDDDDVAEFGAGRESMAGIGTAARSSRIRARHGSGAESFASLASISSLSAPLGGPGPGPGPRSSLNTRFLNIAPGERLSAYSLTEVSVIPPTPPPPP